MRGAQLPGAAPADSHPSFVSISGWCYLREICDQVGLGSGALVVMNFVFSFVFPWLVLLLVTELELVARQRTGSWLHLGPGRAIAGADSGRVWRRTLSRQPAPPLHGRKRHRAGKR